MVRGNILFSIFAYCSYRKGHPLHIPTSLNPLKVELASVRCVKNDQFAVSFQEVLPDA